MNKIVKNLIIVALLNLELEVKECSGFLSVSTKDSFQWISNNPFKFGIMILQHINSSLCDYDNDFNVHDQITEACFLLKGTEFLQDKVVFTLIPWTEEIASIVGKINSIPMDERGIHRIREIIQQG